MGAPGGRRGNPGRVSADAGGAVPRTAHHKGARFFFEDTRRGGELTENAARTIVNGVVGAM